MTRSLPDIIRLILTAAWRRRYLICVPFVLMIPFSIVGANFAAKTYEARTILLLQDNGKENPFLKDLSVGLEIKERFAALQALLKSEHVLYNVLRDIHGPGIEKDQKALALMSRALGSQISAQLVGNDLIELRLKGSTPKGLGSTLAAISKRFVERLLSPERAALGATETFLRDQKEVRRKALFEAEKTFAKFKAENSDKLPAIYASTVQSLSAMRQKLEGKAMELSAAEAALGDMRHQLSSSNPIIGRLEESIIQASSEMTALKSRYTEGHSEVQAAERRLTRLQDERRTYLEGVKTIDTGDIDRLWAFASGQRNSDGKAPPPLLVSQLLRLQEGQSKRAALHADVEQLKASVQELQHSMTEYAPIEQEQQRLEKEVAAARENYELFRKRHDNAATSHALGQFSGADRVKIIDKPQDPTLPVTPPKIIFVIIGIIAGLVMGIGLAIVAELIDPRLRTAEDFQNMIGAPVIARLRRTDWGGALKPAPAS